jgi:predicted ester cyclase
MATNLKNARLLAAGVRALLALVLTLAAVLHVEGAQVDDSAAVAMARPQELIVAGDLKGEARTALLKPVDAFYGFWINGSSALLDEALSPRFIDHTLPPGRPQGPTGPATASKAFLDAVPDLKMTVVQRLVVGDRVVSHLHFSGHFTGTFQDVQGHGQPVDFVATDILRVQGGRVTDNWHLEDNLTFLRQIGLVRGP